MLNENKMEYKEITDYHNNDLLLQAIKAKLDFRQHPILKNSGYESLHQTIVLKSRNCRGYLIEYSFPKFMNSPIARFVSEESNGDGIIEQKITTIDLHKVMELMVIMYGGRQSKFKSDGTKK